MDGDKTARRLKPWSIAARLVASAAACGAVLLLIAGIILSQLYRRATVQAFDERLGVYLRAIVADIAVPGDTGRIEPGQLGEPQFELTLSGWYWQVTRLETDKPEIKASRSLFASQLPRLADLGVPAGVGGARQGFATGPDGGQIRIVERQVDLDDAGVYLVQVAATTEELERRIWQFELALTIAFASLALALAGTTVFQVRYGLRPLRQLGGEIASIRRGEGERVSGAYSDDLAPLAGELNLMISANRDILERARTQVGNLAHALKTPLSVITNEARSADGPLAEKVAEQAAVMRDQVTWYLDRARAAAGARVVGASADVAPAVDGLIGAFRKIYAERAIDFDASVAASVRFRGEKRDFEDMLGNLLDNAGKWAASRVEISAPASGTDPSGRATIDLLVDDDGPGLPVEKRARALTRGQRLDETKPGSGLGLAIVTDLAALHGGALTLEDSPLGGLRARLRLPSA